MYVAFNKQGVWSWIESHLKLNKSYLRKMSSNASDKDEVLRNLVGVELSRNLRAELRNIQLGENSEKIRKKYYREYLLTQK